MISGIHLRLAGAAAALVFLAGCAVAPTPLELADIGQTSNDNREQLQQHEPALKGELTPDKAIARALMYNLDRHVKTLRVALANGQLDVANYDMLPSLTAKAGYTVRNRYAATRSVPFADDKPQSVPGTPNYSVGQEKTRTTYGIDFTWSILDFGLSYVHAKQKADQYLIAGENERKAMHNLAGKVRTAYWKAISANRLLAKVTPLMTKVDKALDNSRKISTQSLVNPLNSYSHERSLLDVKRSLQSLREELVGARVRLAQLMGLPPTTPLNLPQYDSSQLRPNALTLDVDTMERTALLMRPEIRIVDYRHRIAKEDVDAAFLQMFPDLSLTAGYQHDSNKFLRYNDWASAGTAVSYDLLHIFSINASRKAAKTGVAISKKQRLATSLAVLTQVHLANLRYGQARRTLKTSERYLDVSRNISGLVNFRASSGTTGKLTAIKEQLNALVAELRRDLSYADLQNAVARIYQSMGLDLYPSVLPDDVDTLAKRIASRRIMLESGMIAVTVHPIADQNPVLASAGNGESAQFSFSADTFDLAGTPHYRLSTDDSDDLPDWLAFDPATRTFTVTDAAAAHPVTIHVRAYNDDGVYATDSFVLQPGWQTARADDTPATV